MCQQMNGSSHLIVARQCLLQRTYHHIRFRTLQVQPKIAGQIAGLCNVDW